MTPAPSPALQATSNSSAPPPQPPTPQPPAAHALPPAACLGLQHPSPSPRPRQPALTLVYTPRTHAHLCPPTPHGPLTNQGLPALPAGQPLPAGLRAESPQGRGRLGDWVQEGGSMEILLLLLLLLLLLRRGLNCPSSGKQPRPPTIGSEWAGLAGSWEEPVHIWGP